MAGRTYRYFTGQPLWPFGYGLSYTSFKYGNLTLPAAPIAAGAPLNASVKVTNTGKLAGRDLSMVTQSGDRIVAQGTYTVSVGGGQPGTGAPSVSGTFEVNGQIQLPE